MNIPESVFKSIWSYDKDGNEYVPSEDNLNEQPPEGYTTHHVLVPNFVVKKILKTPIQEEIDKCEHKETQRIPFVSMIEARQCKSCGGVQFKDANATEWTDRWVIDRPLETEAEIFGNAWPIELVEAMVKSGEWSLKKAILLTAQCCPNCLHKLASKYNVNLKSIPPSDPKFKCDICQYMT